jgi:hypothetical protein
MMMKKQKKILMIILRIGYKYFCIEKNLNLPEYHHKKIRFLKTHMIQETGYINNAGHFYDCAGTSTNIILNLSVLIFNIV